MIIGFLSVIIYLCLFMLRGWLYFNHFNEEISPLKFLKRFFAFDLPVLISVMDLRLKKDQLSLNILTVILWVFICIFIFFPELFNS